MRVLLEVHHILVRVCRHEEHVGVEQVEESPGSEVTVSDACLDGLDTSDEERVLGVEENQFLLVGDCVDDVDGEGGELVELGQHGEDDVGDFGLNALLRGDNVDCEAVSGVGDRQSVPYTRFAGRLSCSPKKFPFTS
eukprot:746672-Hanusia_phi.AAC.3